jgi:CubicO group peptidase (beta-lactamase class C family)
MRPMDMLKIGQLMLDDGVWQGKQIINKQWIRDSMDRTHNPYSYAQYGYLWWYGSYIDAAGKIYSAVLARGWGGQEIAIIKELDLVVVNTASNYEMESKLDEMIHNFILPAFLNEKE